MMNVAFFIAVALLSLVSAQHLVTSNPPNFSYYVFRLAQSGITNNGANITSTQTQFNGQVQVFLTVNGAAVEQIATINAGADAVTSYFTRSIDVAGFQPGQVSLRFNTSGVQVGADCILAQFSTQSTRTTCALVQSVLFLVPTTPVCSFVGGTCAAPSLNISNAVNQFAVTTSNEKLDTRVCDTSQLFVRGVAPTCPNRIRRNTAPAGVLASESVILNTIINPTPFTTGGDVPTTQLARANDYRFENPTSTSLSGVSRAFEAIVGAASITVAARTTGFVKLLNAAHREFTPVGGSAQAESSLIFVIRDSQNLVVHFESVNTGQQSSFIELPTGQYKFNTYSGRNQRVNIIVTNPNTLLGTVSADLVFTLGENQYNLVAATTATNDPTFQVDSLQRFDVTPATNTVAGTTEHQIVNLLLAPSLSQDVKLLRNVVVSADSLQCTSFGAVTNSQSSTLAAQSAALTLEIALGAGTGCTTCGRSTYASPATLSLISTGSCGKRVTVLIGRPYTLDTLTNVPFCATPLNATTVEIGDLSFVGTRFSKFAGSSNPLQILAPVSFEIQNCACAAAAVTCTETQNLCDSQRIVALGGAVGGVASAVGGVASAVGGVASSVSGVASAVGGVGAAVGIVQTQARNINGTLVAVRTQLGNVATNVGDIKKDIEEKNKGIQDVLDNVEKDVSDTKNDVSDIKKDLEENKKGLIDRVQKLSDECNQACDANP